MVAFFGAAFEFVLPSLGVFDSIKFVGLFQLLFFQYIIFFFQVPSSSHKFSQFHIIAHLHKLRSLTIDFPQLVMGG